MAHHYGLTPFFPRWFDDLERSHSLFDQSFGQPLLEEDLMMPSLMMPTSMMPSWHPLGYQQHPALQHHGHGRRGVHHHGSVHHPEVGQVAPSRPTFDRHRSGLSRVVNDKTHFKVSLDVHQFKPEEITVKTVDGNFVIIEGKHEEKEDEHGYIQRHFVRKYLLPEGVKAENVKSTLSSDGVLVITAPKPQQALEGGNERVVQIEHSPYPAIGGAAGAMAHGGKQQHGAVVNGHAGDAPAASTGDKMES